jgi:transaldolase
VRSRIDREVEPRIVEGLTKKFADFRRANTESGLKVEEFDSFGATRQTLRQFITACDDLDALVRDVMIPKPETA